MSLWFLKFQGKPTNGRSCFWVVRGNQFNRRCPRHDVLHLLEKYALAHLSKAKINLNGISFHGINVDTMCSGTRARSMSNGTLTDQRSRASTNRLRQRFLHPYRRSRNAFAHICRWCPIQFYARQIVA